MTCKKNNPGDPCCESDCCAPLTVPSGWTLISDCCAQLITEISDSWTVACSDSVRTDTRSASVDYKIWKTPRPDYDESDPTAITCITDPFTGIETCTGSGGDLPPCDGDEELCNTVTETHSITTESRVIIRYKRVRRVDTLARVETACDGGGSTCKWILISRMVYLVQSGQYDVVDEDYSITDTATDTCCGSFSTTTSTTDTCASLAATFTGGTEISLCRAKYFTSAPSGTITFNPGDTIVCTPLTEPCTSLCSDEVEFCSTDPGEIAWEAPACVPITDTILCLVTIHYTDLDDNEVCGLYPNGDQITINLINVTGDLLSGVSVAYTCPDDCDVRPSSYYISRIECDNLTSSRTDPGYVADCITLTSAAWTTTV
jgi:hypothetical protein